MVNFTLGPIVDATNRPSFYGDLGFSPLTLGGFGSFDYLPIPPPPIGWYPSLLWRSPLSRWGDEYLAYDVFDAGSRLLNWGNIWQAEPEYFPYFWNELMWRNWNPWVWPTLPPMPQFFNPWPAYSYQPQGVSVIGTPMPRPTPPPVEKPKEEENNSKEGNGGGDQTKIGSKIRSPRRQSQPMNTIVISKQGLPSDTAQSRQELMNRLVQRLGGEGELRMFQDRDGRWRDVYLLSNGKTYILEDRGNQIIATEYPI